MKKRNKNAPNGRFYCVTNLFQLRTEGIEGLAVTDDDKLAVLDGLGSFSFGVNMLHTLSFALTFGHTFSGYHEVVVTRLSDVKELAVILAIILMEDEVKRYFAVRCLEVKGCLVRSGPCAESFAASSCINEEACPAGVVGNDDMMGGVNHLSCGRIGTPCSL